LALQGLQGLQAFFAAQGLQAFLAAQGFLAAHGLHAFLAAHGFLPAHGLALQAASWMRSPAMAVAVGKAAALDRATAAPRARAVRASGNFFFCIMKFLQTRLVDPLGGDRKPLGPIRSAKQGEEAMAESVAERRKVPIRKI
jgi:hypothetical protein